MSDYTNNFMDQLFGAQKSQNPLDEANKAIKKIKELNEKIQKNQKEITILKAQLTQGSPSISKKVDRILGILQRLESQGSMSMEDIRGLRVQVEGLK